MTIELLSNIYLSQNLIAKSQNPHFSSLVKSYLLLWNEYSGRRAFKAALTKQPDPTF